MWCSFCYFIFPLKQRIPSCHSAPVISQVPAASVNFKCSRHISQARDTPTWYFSDGTTPPKVLAEFHKQYFSLTIEHLTNICVGSTNSSRIPVTAGQQYSSLLFFFSSFFLCCCCLNVRRCWRHVREQRQSSHYLQGCRFVLLLLTLFVLIVVLVVGKV